jgi:hypothetical protein
MAIKTIFDEYLVRPREDLVLASLISSTILTTTLLPIILPILKLFRNQPGSWVWILESRG